MNTIKIKPAFKDKRGLIFDILDEVQIDAVTFITFKKGAIRGNHFHKKTTQWNFVTSGKILFYTKKKGQSIKKHILKKNSLTVTKPNEIHAFKALSDSEMLVFTKGPRHGKEYESDTFREAIVKK